MALLKDILTADKMVLQKVVKMAVKMAVLMATEWVGLTVECLVDLSVETRGLLLGC